MEDYYRNWLNQITGILRAFPEDRIVGNESYAKICSLFWKLRNKVADFERGEYE